MNLLTHLKQTTLPLPVTIGLACFGLLPQMQAVAPTPDGCYANFTTAEGCDALNSLTVGAGNTALGWRSLFLNTDGSFNTGVGGGALALNDGSSNTAVGAAALLLNSSGSNNTAVGTDALVNNTVDGNTATGAFALFANTIGGTLETSVSGYPLGPNTAFGSHALENNVDGSANTAVGYNALNRQVTGYTLGGAPHFAANTAIGFEALGNVTGSATGSNAINTALGYEALADLTDGFANTAVGALAGTGLTTGVYNVNVGFLAGVGNVTGSGNIFIGYSIGPALPGELGHTYIGNIASTSQPSGGSIDFVTIDLSTGLLGHNSSSRRYKEDIKPMDKSSEALYRLNPVSYRLKKEIEKHQSRAFGLIAEEVAEVNPDLVVRNAQGQVEGVHYEMVNAMLLNEFLKEHKKVEQLRVTVAQQQRDFQAAIAKLKEVVTAQLNEQAAQIQKVSAQLELRKSAPQTALSDQ
jgi:trimeric autotransporter adhesin